jgi:hypothetical protein
MKYHVIRFKDLNVALKKIEPMVRDPRRLRTGKPLEKFEYMRPREMLANWLLCATFETIEGRELMFYSDPIGGDGLIRDEATEKTGKPSTSTSRSKAQVRTLKPSSSTRSTTSGATERPIAAAKP